jgi:phage baseplate assembly protein gpV
MLPLLAAVVLSAGPSLPFPAPRLAQVTERTKFDPGVVAGYDAARTELRVQCAAGMVVFKAGGDVQTFDKDGQPVVGGPARLVVGQKVRVWYVVDNGARAQEIAVVE